MMSFFKIVLLVLILFCVPSQKTFIYLCLDWLIDWHWLLRTAPYSRPSLWVSVLPGSSQTDTWTPGDWVQRLSLSLGFKQAPRPVQDLLAGKRALKSSPWVARQQPLDLRTTNLSRRGSSRRRCIVIICLFHFKRKIYIWNSLYLYIMSIFERPWEVGLDWLAEVPYRLAL